MVTGLAAYGRWMPTALLGVLILALEPPDTAPSGPHRAPPPTCREDSGYVRCRDEVVQSNPSDDPRRLWEISDAILNDAHGNSDKIHPTSDLRCAEDDISTCSGVSKLVSAKVTPGFAAQVDWTRLRYPVVVAIMENRGFLWQETRYRLRPLEIGGRHRTVLLIHPSSNDDTSRWTSFHLRRKGNQYTAEEARNGSFVRCDATTHPEDESAAAWTGCNGKKMALDSIVSLTRRSRESITHAELASFVLPLGRNSPFTDAAWITCANGCCEFQN